ncbi:helix-turn-helix domain-containing protein [Nocardia sp. R6R-6]|uniref:helix-turn-helix domain-containing protein n=1 Tax=Nocardia sp. R6R-6 TaxID=3459303 RepID=UPI00403E331C
MIDRNGQPAIPAVRFKASAGAHVIPLAALPGRARNRGMDLYGPVRLDFHQVVAVTSGSLTCSVDFTEHTLTKGDWIWVKPGQIFQHHSDLDAVGGTIIFFPSGFLDAATATAAHEAPLTLRDTPPRPSADTRDLLERLLELLQIECDRPGALPVEVHIDVVRHLVSVVLLHLAHTHELQVGGAAGSAAFLRFRNAVERDFARTHRVADYAVRLGYSVRTLTRASQEAVGYGAKRLIDDRVLLEAKRLLAHTDLTASMIGKQLGFPDATVFIRFFRRQTSRTPTAFRVHVRGG